ncbi:MAG: lysophospholipid acyltransferase family protein [Sphingomonadaceae bacterium]
MRTVAGALAATGALVPTYLAVRNLSPRARLRLQTLYLDWLARSIGLRLHVHGEPAPGPVLFVSNHLSWLDIVALGARLEGAFVAKAEVGRMALVNFLANLRETIYVEREQRSRASDQANRIVERLAAGGNVILFPEGTSNDGLRIFPFKSTLFAGLDQLSEVRIQPITIAYTELNGLPLTRNRLLELAWIGDMELAPHAMDVSRLGRVRADIVAHEAVRAADFPDRKALARHCRTEIEASYRRFTRGQARAS